MKDDPPGSTVEQPQVITGKPLPDSGQLVFSVLETIHSMHASRKSAPSVPGYHRRRRVVPDDVIEDGLVADGTRRGVDGYARGDGRTGTFGGRRDSAGPPIGFVVHDAADVSGSDQVVRRKTIGTGEQAGLWRAAAQIADRHRIADHRPELVLGGCGKDRR